jgi:hypothetical protein
VINPHWCQESDLRLIAADVTGNAAWIRFRYMDLQIINIYLSPKLGVAECVQILRSAIPAKKKDEKVLIMGDFNMRMGQFARDHTENARGRELRAWLESSGFQYRQTVGPQYTFQRQEGCSVIDQVWIRTANPQQLIQRAWVVQDVARRVSPHHPVVIEFAGRMCDRTPPATTYLRWNLRELDDEQTRAHLDNVAQQLADQAMPTLDMLLQPLIVPDTAIEIEQAQAVVDKAWEVIKTVLEAAAEAALGPQQRVRKRIETVWERPEVRRAKRILNGAYARYLLYKGTEQEAAKRADVQQAQRAFQFANQRASSGITLWDTDSAQQRNQAVVKMAANIKRRTTTQPAGSGLECTARALSEYAAHFARVTGSPQANADNLPAPPRPSGRISTVQSTVALSQHDFAEAIKRSPTSSAPGEDGLPAEIFQACSGAASQMFTTLSTAIFSVGLVPHAWTTGIVHPVWKQRGDDADIQTYRPITLTAVARKIFERAMLKHLIQEMGHGDIAQAGFKQKAGVVDNIVLLDALQQIAVGEELPYAVAFLDIKGAYDTVDRAHLWPKVQARGASQSTLRVLQSLFEPCTARLVVNNKQSPAFWFARGIFQGTVLSPFLYTVFMDDLPPLLRPVSHNAFWIEEQPHNSLLYADDIALIAASQAELQDAMDICQQHAEANNYEFSPSKCKVITSQRWRQQFGPHATVTLNGQHIEVVDEFKYLGRIFTADGLSMQRTFDTAFDKARKAAFFWKLLGADTLAYTPDAAIRLYLTFVRPVFEFAMEVVCLSQQACGRFEDLQIGILRRAMGLPETASHVGCLVLANVPTVRARNHWLHARFWARLQTAPQHVSIARARWLLDNPATNRSAMTLDPDANPLLPWFDEQHMAYAALLEPYVSTSVMRKAVRSLLGAQPAGATDVERAARRVMRLRNDYHNGTIATSFDHIFPHRHPLLTASHRIISPTQIRTLIRLRLFALGAQPPFCFCQNGMSAERTHVPFCVDLPARLANLNLNPQPAQSYATPLEYLIDSLPHLPKRRNAHISQNSLQLWNTVLDVGRTLALNYFHWPFA